MQKKEGGFPYETKSEYFLDVVVGNVYSRAKPGKSGGPRSKDRLYITTWSRELPETETWAC